MRAALSRATVVLVAIIALSGCEGLFDSLVEELFLDTLEPAELEVEIVNLPDDFDRADVWVSEADTEEILSDGVDPSDEDAVEEAVKEWLDDQEVPDEIPGDFVAGYGISSEDDEYDGGNDAVEKKVSPDAELDDGTPPEIINDDQSGQIEGNVYVVNAAVTENGGDESSSMNFGAWFAIVGADSEAVSSTTLDFGEHFTTD